jgi:hypothetical protein
MFFGTGYFRAEAMDYREGDCLLTNTIRVPYFDRLDRDFLQPDGDYVFTDSGRYWSKMNFPSRKQVNVRMLETQVTVTEDESGVSLAICCRGCEKVPIALEFQFPGEGSLSGHWAQADDVLSLFEKDYNTRPENMRILKEDVAVYSCGGGSITIGPGRCEHDWLPYLHKTDFFPLEKELPERQFVYMTLYAPFHVTIKIQ